MLRIITVAFGYFLSELCPFDCSDANFVYTNLAHTIT